MKKTVVRTKLLLVLILVLAALSQLIAQQDPLYAHYMFNKLLYNPAYAGTNPEFYCVNFLAHNQWTGFSSNGDQFVGLAPQTQTFSFNAPFKDKKVLGGYGVSVINDKLGYEDNKSVNASFSVKKYLSKGILFAGINVGAVQRTLENRMWLTPDGPYIYDKSIPVGIYSDIIPDFGAGIYYFSPYRYFIGISSQHLSEGQFNLGGSKNHLVRQSYVSAGYNFSLPYNPDFELQSSFLFKIDKAKQQIDAGINLFYRNSYWAGIHYRQGDAVSVMAGMKLMNNMLFSYSFDVTTSGMKDYTSGTHEVMIIYCFRIKDIEIPDHIIWTPRFM